MKRHGQHGQALVEYALSATVFVTMLMFLFDGSRILWNYVTLAEAARVGARYAITHGANSASPVGPGNIAPIRGHIEANVAGLDPDDLTVAATWSTSNNPGNKVTVSLTYRARPLTGMFWPGLTIDLHSRSSMIIEY